MNSYFPQPDFECTINWPANRAEVSLNHQLGYSPVHYLVSIVVVDGDDIVSSSTAFSWAISRHAITIRHAKLAPPQQEIHVRVWVLLPEQAARTRESFTAALQSMQRALDR